MKIFVLSPSAEKTFSIDQLARLKKVGEVVMVNETIPFLEIPEIMNSGEKIVAIDPDFCAWTIHDGVATHVPDLKAICLQSTAYDWINLDLCKEKGVAVYHIPGYSTESVAEWAWMMTLMLARKIPTAIRQGWEEDFETLKGVDLADKTVGIVGLGKIGSAMAKLGQGLGMQVQYWSNKSRNDKYRLVGLETLFTSSDVIMVAMVESEVTKKIITDRMLRSMKKGVIVSSINAVHHLYNHELVLEMTKSGQVFGYGFEGHAEKFNEFEGNILATPSIAWCTKESWERCVEIWTQNIISAAKGSPTNKV